jgi:hypothetical protein
MLPGLRLHQLKPAKCQRGSGDRLRIKNKAAHRFVMILDPPTKRGMYRRAEHPREPNRRRDVGWVVAGHPRKKVELKEQFGTALICFPFEYKLDVRRES